MTDHALSCRDRLVSTMGFYGKVSMINILLKDRGTSLAAITVVCS